MNIWADGAELRPGLVTCLVSIPDITKELPANVRLRPGLVMYLSIPDITIFRLKPGPVTCLSRILLKNGLLLLG